MPQVGQFLIAVGKFVTFGKAAGTTAAIIGAFTVAGTVHLTSRMMKLPKGFNDNDQGRQRTVRSTVEPQKLVYGETMVSGPLTYAQVSGAHNKYLHQVVALAGHELTSIQAVYLDDKSIDLTNTNVYDTSQQTEPYSVRSGFFGPKTNESGTSETVVYIDYRLGASSQTAYAGLLADNVTSNEYLSTHRGDGIASLYTRWTIHEGSAETWDAVGGVQNIKAVVRGKKIYDPRLDVNAGNSAGDNPTTAAYVVYSDNTLSTGSSVGDYDRSNQGQNPALILADYLMDSKFGLGLSASKIDWDSIVAAADHCDQLVAIPTSATQKRFFGSGVIFGNDEHKKSIEKILSAMNGTLVYSQGKYIVRAGVYFAATETLTEDDLIGPVQITTSIPKADRINTIKGVFIDPSENYKDMEFGPVTVSGAVARDNGETLTEELKLPFTSNRYAAQRIAKKIIHRSFLQTTIQVPVNLKGMRIAIGDRVNVTLSALNEVDSGNWSPKIFKCVAWSFSENSDGGINLTLVEDDTARYVDPAENEYSTVTAEGTIVRALPDVPSPTNFTATAGINRVELNWTNPSNAAAWEQVWLFASDTNTTPTDSSTPIAKFRGTSFTHLVNGGDTKYYWIQAVRYAPGSTPSSGQSNAAKSPFIASSPTNVTASKITNAVMGDDSVDTAQVVDDAIGSDQITDLQSSNYSNTAGSEDGWKILQDGSAEFNNVVIRGNVNATSGTIGGTTVTSSELYQYSGSGSPSHGNSDTDFWLDDSGNFSLKDKLVWTGGSTNTLVINGSGTFSGSLSSASGTFTGALSGGTISIGSNNDIFKADSNGIYLGNATFGSAPFRVTPAGALTATSATITGAITATSGSIANSVTIGGTAASTVESGAAAGATASQVNKGLALLLNSTTAGSANNGEAALVGVDKTGTPETQTDGFIQWKGSKVTIERNQYSAYTILTNIANKRGFIVFDVNKTNPFTVASTALDVVFAWKEGDQWYYDDNSATPVSFSISTMQNAGAELLAIGYLETSTSDLILTGGLIEPVQLETAAFPGDDYKSGTIGGININTSSIYSGSHSTYASTAQGFFIGSNGTMSFGDGTQQTLTFDTGGNLSITGAVNATSGTFTGSIAAGSGTSVTIVGDASYPIYSGDVYEGNSASNDPDPLAASFRVSSDGTVFAKKIDIRDSDGNPLLSSADGIGAALLSQISLSSGAGVDSVSGTTSGDAGSFALTTTSSSVALVISTKVAIKDNSIGTLALTGQDSTEALAKERLIGGSNYNGAKIRISFEVDGSVTDTHDITFVDYDNLGSGEPTSTQIAVNANYVGGSFNKYLTSLMDVGGAIEYIANTGYTGAYGSTAYALVTSKTLTAVSAGSHTIKIKFALLDKVTNSAITSTTYTGTGIYYTGQTSGTLGNGQARRLYELTDANTINFLESAANTFSEAGSSVLTSGGTVSGDLSVTGSLSVTGDFNLTGDINQYNVTNLDVVDKTITVSKGGTQALSDGAGLIVDRGTAADASILWNESYDYFNFSHPVGRPLLASGAAAFWTSTNNNDITLLRVTSSSDTAYADKSGYGFSLKYIGSGSNNDNSLNLYADNQNNPNQSLAFKVLQDGTMTFSQDATFVGSVTWSGGGSANANTAYTYSQVGHLPLAGGTLSGTLDAAAGLQLSNTNITEVNALSFNDPGPGEGISWSNGNWAIYESPDDLTTNTAGNLQFVSGGNRKVTFNTSGDGYFAGTVTTNNEIIIDVPATTGTGTGPDTFALLLKNTDVNYTADALTAFNATTSWNMPDSTSFMASSRPGHSSIWAYMTEFNGPAVINRFIQLDDAATHGSGMVQNVFYQYDGAGTAATDMKVPVGELETWATYDGTNGVIEQVSITAAGFVHSKGYGIAGTTVIDASRNLHANGDANLADGAVPNVSGGTAYFPTKMVSPKIVFLNDAAGDDNYIVSNDGNSAYTVNGNNAGVWFEFYGDKVLSHAGLVFDYWKGKGMELSRVGSDAATTGTTFITIDNDVGSDLSQQKSFIDFVFKDANSNEYPQVRIGAEVGPDSDANTTTLEGKGAFVVYTNNATTDGSSSTAATGLSERFRVSYNGDTTTEGNIKAGQWFRGNSNTNTLYSSTSLGTLVQAPSNSGVGGRVIFRDSNGNAYAYVQTDTGQMVGYEFATLNGGNFVGSNLAQTGTTSQTVGVLKSILISHSPEGNHAAHPYLLNDLASCRLRGGTVAFSGLTTNPSDSAIDAIFEPNASNLSVANTNYSGGANSTFTITITPPRSLNYTTYAGISFGSGSFAPSSLKIEFSNDGGTNYTTALDSSIADHNYSAYLNTGSSLINRIRYTIGYPSSSSIRITNIWAYNYNSEGMDHYFLPRKGGVIWGKITVPDGSATAPAYSFNQDTGNGTYLEWYVQNEAKHQVSISTDGVRRAHFNEAGIWTSANFYLSSGGSVRSFDEWLATTGTTGKGFKFTNTVDQVDALTLTAAGNATFAGTISSGAITSTTTAATAIVANRSNAGVVIDIQKNGVSSGSIGTEGTNLAINSAGSGGYGRLQDNGSDVAVWWTNGIYPATDNTKNLGASSTSGRWKNLFMANGIYMNGSQIVDSSRNLTNIGTITTSSTIKVDSSTHAYLTLDNGGAYESGIIFQRAGTSKWEQYISSSLDRMRFYSYGPSQIQMDILDGVDGNGGTIFSGLKIVDSSSPPQWAGSYGNLILNTNSTFTSSSRGWMITNAYEANKFALLYSSSATTLPGLTTNGAAATGTSVALKIDNAGAATFGNTIASGAITVDISTDSAFVTFKKSGSEVGKIFHEASTSRLTMGTGNAGLSFIDSGQDRIIPRKSGGGNANDSIDLGDGASQWRDLWLSNALRMAGTSVITSGRALQNLTSISLTGTALTAGELPSNLQGNYFADHMSHTDPSNANRNYCLTMFKEAELWAKNASTQAWSKISDTSTGTLGNIFKGYAGGNSSGAVSLSQTYDEFIIYFGTGTTSSLGYAFIGMMKLEHSTSGNSFVAYLETKESFTNVYESGWTEEYETNSISSWPGATSHKVSFGVGSGNYRDHLRLRIVPNWQHASNGMTLYNVNILGNYGSRSSLFNWAHDRKVTFNNNTIFQGGSAASPSLTCIGDEDTGIYFPAANQFGISIGGTAALTINSSRHATFAGNIVNSSGYVQTGGLYLSGNALVLNANGNGWNTWATRSNGQFNLSVGTITSGAITSSGNITVNNDTNGLTINSATNGGTAQITMCDNGTNGSGTQKFYITHNHTDGSSYGSGAVLRFHTTESTGTILADGKLMFSEGLYIKPSSGTGAGTVVIQDNGTYRAPNGTAALPSVSFLNDSNTGIYRPTTDALAFSTGGVERLTIDSSGNTNIAQNENLIIGSGASNTGSIQLYLGHTTAYNLTIAGSTTAREVNFKGSGSSADYNFRFYNLSTGSAHLQVQGNVTAYASISDINRKENIEIIPDALEKVKKLDGITFNFKGDNKSMTGLIAQQVQDVLPQAVYETETLDGEPTLALHYANTVGLLVEAIKTLEAQVSSLTKKIEELENDKDN